MYNPFKSFDSFLINIINKRMNKKYFSFIFYNITKLGNTPFVIVFVIFLLMLKNTRTLGLEILLGVILTSIFVQVLKRTFARNRPYWILENLNTFGIDLSDYSFPSGHSAASFSVAVIIAFKSPELAVFVLTIAALIAISRIYLAVHYPTDVLAGIIIGVVCSLIVHYKLYPIVATYLKNNYELGGIFKW